MFSIRNKKKEILIGVAIIVAAAAGYYFYQKSKRMKLLLIRTKKTDTYTEGKMYIDGVYFCDTIEDKERVLNSAADKVYSQTAIPAGNYKVTVEYRGGHFNRKIPVVNNVPYFTGILIHNGTTERSSAGCIIVGKKIKDGHLDGNNTRQISDNLTAKLLEAQNAGKALSIKIVSI